MDGADEHAFSGQVVGLPHQDTIGSMNLNACLKPRMDPGLNTAPARNDSKDFRAFSWMRHKLDDVFPFQLLNGGNG